jgi:outer membrane protein
MDSPKAPSIRGRRRAERRRSVVVLTATLLAAAGVRAATLGEILDLARDADAQYAAARAAASAGQEKRVQGQAGLLPTLSLGGNARSNHDTPLTFPVPPRSYQSYLLGLSLNQPLLRRVNVETAAQGELQAQQADQQLRLAEQELLVRVAKGYFDVLQAQDALGAMTAQKEAIGQQLAQSKRGFEVGLAPITDVNEAQARYDLTVAQEIAARNELELKRRTLEKSINRDLPPLALLDEKASIDIIPEGHLQALVDRAPVESLQVQLGETAEVIARREVRRQDAAQMPTFDLVASYNENKNANTSTTGVQSKLRSGYAGIEFSAPLFTGGAAQSRVREAQANLERAQQELLNARRQARLDSRQAYLGVQSGTALHEALHRALQSSETQLRSTRRGFEVGVRTRVDVLNAEQQLYATRKDLAAARYQTLVAALQLKAAAGSLTEHDLRALDRLLLQK